MILRTDLPPGTAAAMAVHAAGESAALNHPTPGTFAVVLGASVAQLGQLASQLGTMNVPHVLITEPDAPWCGAPMALGVAPLDRSTVREVLRHLRLYKGPCT